jgi:hypothetical protein
MKACIDIWSQEYENVLSPEEKPKLQEVKQMAKPREGMGRIAITLKLDTIQRIEQEAEVQGFSTSIYMQTLLNEYYKAADSLKTFKDLNKMLELYSKEQEGKDDGEA